MSGAPGTNYYLRCQSESSQPSSKTGVKLAEPSERTTSGKYSYTHDDLIDPDD